MSMPLSKKRKISHGVDNVDVALTFTEFTIRPCGTSLSDRPRTFKPITLLPRSLLPLSWLNSCPNLSGNIQSGSLFTANIPALEGVLSSQKEPVVLAARLGRTRCDNDYDDDDEVDGVGEGLYIVEKVKQGIYSICALYTWVHEKDLTTASLGWQSKTVNTQSWDNFIQAPSDDDAEVYWLDKAGIPDLVDYGNPKDCQESDISIVFGSNGWESEYIHGNDPLDSVELVSTLADTFPENMLVDPSSDGRTNDGRMVSYDKPVENSDLQPIGHETMDFVKIEQPEISSLLQGPEETLAALRTQYLETLYVSKTSVAYFAKGPLSRARAAFQATNDGSTLQPMNLYNFYHDSIIPMKRMDVKYRDSLPEAVRQLTKYISDDEMNLKGGNKKKRASKKNKLGKNGMYSDEEYFISKWWKNTNRTEIFYQSNMEAELKQLIGELRLREMQLQILLILETMSLESAIGPVTSVDASAEVGELQRLKKNRKKSQSLKTSLELLVDRLCIWHAVTFDGTRPDDAVSELDKKSPSEKLPDNDKLRDFCTEVVIPFYSSRLPEQCQAINQKFGGPISGSPLRPKISSVKPGASVSSETLAKKLQSQGSRRKLQRAKSDAKVLDGNPPALLRANTAPTVQEIKGEPSEPLSVISGRGGIRKSRRMDNREVDLDAVAKQHETKMKKMNSLLDQKKELDAAIRALRKPNRELVSRDFADSVELRSSAPHPKKQKNPMRNPFGQGVQVMATPKGPRTKNCSTTGLPLLPDGWKRPKVTTTLSPPADSDIQVVPSSASRPRNQPTTRTLDSNMERPQPIYETPSKSSMQRTRHTSQLSASNRKFKPRTGSASFIHPGPPSPMLHNSKSPLPIGNRRSGDVDIDSSPGVYETPQKNSQTRLSNGPGHSSLDGQTDSVLPSTPAKRSHLSTNSQKYFDADHRNTTNAAPSKSIYEQLGWDDDNDDDDELAF